jgi:hypothetical protein
LSRQGLDYTTLMPDSRYGKQISMMRLELVNRVIQTVRVQLVSSPAHFNRTNSRYRKQISMMRLKLVNRVIQTVGIFVVLWDVS